MKKTFEFDSIKELNNWFRKNIDSYKGYYYQQYKDLEANKWILAFSK